VVNSKNTPTTDLRLAYVISDPNIDLSKRGGPRTHIMNTIHGFERHGIQVRVFAASDYREKNNIGESPPSSRKSKPRKKNRIRSIISEARVRIKAKKLPRQLESDLEEFAPHCMYERSWIFSDGFIAIARKLDSLIILETSTCEAEIHQDIYGLFSVPLTNWREGRKLRRSDAVATQSSASVSVAREKFKLPPSLPVIAKPLSYEIPGSLPPRADLKAVDELSAQFGLIVIFIGTFGRYQGPEFLMEVIEQSQRQSLDVGFILCGAGGEQKSCAEFAEFRELRNVLFTGMLNDNELSHVGSVAHLAIVPDCDEHMAPIKMHEYASHGLSVLVPDYVAFDEFGAEQNAVLRFEPGNASSVTDLLRRCADAEIDVAAGGRDLREIIGRSFDSYQVTSGIVRFIREGRKSSSDD